MFKFIDYKDDLDKNQLANIKFSEQTIDYILSIEEFYQDCRNFQQELYYIEQSIKQENYWNNACDIIKEYGLSKPLYQLLNKNNALTSIISQEELIDIGIYKEKYIVAIENLLSSALKAVSEIGNALVEIMRWVLKICNGMWNWIFKSSNAMFTSIGTYADRYALSVKGLTNSSNFVVPVYRFDNNDFTKYQTQFNEFVKQNPSPNKSKPRFLAETYIFPDAVKGKYTLCCNAKEYEPLFQRIETHLQQSPNFMIYVITKITEFLNDLTTVKQLKPLVVKTKGDQYYLEIEKQYNQDTKDLTAIQAQFKQSKSEYVFPMHEMDALSPVITKFDKLLNSQASSNLTTFQSEYTKAVQLISATPKFGLVEKEIAMHIGKFEKLVMTYNQLIVNVILSNLFKSYNSVSAAIFHSQNQY